MAIAVLASVPPLWAFFFFFLGNWFIYSINLGL